MTLDNELQRRLEALKGLPSPPRVAMRILEAARDPDVRLAQVADVVTVDPVITAKIMRTANSAIYARPGGCTTLRQALVLLGLDATLIIALSFSLVMNLRRDRSDGMDHELYWRRSLLAATGARALGNAMGRPDGEALFLSALLQDIGMLAIDKLDAGLYAEAGDIQRDHRAISAFERDRLGADHADIGAWLMQRWQLPDPVITAIRASHDPTDQTACPFSRCVALAGPLADVWMSTDWSYSFRELVALAVDSLGMDHVQLGMVLDELRRQIPETEAMFEKDLIGPGEEFVALDEARELLMTLGVDGYMKAAVIEQRQRTAAASDAPTTLMSLSHRDELQEALVREHHEARASGEPATLMVARINGLDAVAERHGDETANRSLRRTAMLMLDNAGARIVGQHADHELVLWLAATSAEAAALATQRVQRAFTEAMDELTGVADGPLTLSIGCASVEQDAKRDVEALIEMARSAFAGVAQQPAAAVKADTAEVAG